jgi:hypothetical protein
MVAKSYFLEAIFQTIQVLSWRQAVQLVEDYSQLMMDDDDWVILRGYPVLLEVMPTVADL